MKRISSLLAVAVAVACSEAFQPTIDNVMGDYTARTFTATDTSGTTDLLKAGAVFTLSLALDDTTFGYLYVPAAVAGGTELIADMAGNWTLTNGQVHVSRDVDTFVRDMPFVAGNRRLEGDKTFSGVRVRVVLTK